MSNLAKAKLLTVGLATDEDAEDGAVPHPQSVRIAALVVVDLGYIELIIIKKCGSIQHKRQYVWTYLVIATHF